MELTGRRVEVVSKMDARPVVDFIAAKLVIIIEVADINEDNSTSLQIVMTHWVIIGFDDGRIHKRFPSPLIRN
jgi:hypothetical protein